MPSRSLVGNTARHFGPGPFRLGCASFREFGVQLCTVAGFEWDPRKAASNVSKHGVHFADAVAVFEDDRAITVRDGASDDERWITVGMDALARIIIVVYTWRGERIRIISARLATPSEFDQYLVNG